MLHHYRTTDVVLRRREESKTNFLNIIAAYREPGSDDIKQMVYYGKI